MGSFAPVPGLDDQVLSDLTEAFVRPVLLELARRGTPFVGTLFAGLMLTADAPRVLEYNCRFGDPEAQSVLPLVDGDLLGALAAAAAGSLAGVSLGRTGECAVTVVLAAGDYPQAGNSGTPIEGIAEAEGAGGLVFHAGTALRDGRLVTNGGRILGITATGPTRRRAAARIHGRRPGQHPGLEAAGGHRADGVGRAMRKFATSALYLGHPNPPPTFDSIVKIGNSGDEIVPTSCRLRAGKTAGGHL